MAEAGDVESTRIAFSDESLNSVIFSGDVAGIVILLSSAVFQVDSTVIQIRKQTVDKLLCAVPFHPKKLHESLNGYGGILWNIAKYTG